MALLAGTVSSMMPGATGGWYGSWSAASASCSLPDLQSIGDSENAQQAAAGAAAQDAEASPQQLRAEGIAAVLPEKHAAAGSERSATAGGGVARCSLGQQFLEDCLSTLFQETKSCSHQTSAHQHC